MYRTAARLVPVIQHAERRRACICIRPPSHGLALRIRTRVLTLEEAQLVHCPEVGLDVTRSAFECDDAHARARELGRDDGAGGAYADNDDIGLFGRHLRCSVLWIGA